MRIGLRGKLTGINFLLFGLVILFLVIFASSLVKTSLLESAEGKLNGDINMVQTVFGHAVPR